LNEDAPKPPPLPYAAPVKSASVLLAGLMGAVVLGAIGFVAGFVGPIIFMPEANQGPLLGIFITGPGGAIVGFVIGIFVGVWRKRQRR
jgi:uncharacterized membrane protein